MKRLQTVIVTLLFASITVVNAQSKFGVGMSTAIFPSWNPGLPLTPYIFFQHNDHEVLAGPDIYGGQLGFGSIIGVEAEYKYHFYALSKNLNLFAHINFQYVRFANGPAQSVPYNYSEFVAPGLNFSMIQMRTFNNTIGIGLQYWFWKVCALHLCFGGGYHYYHNTITPSVNLALVNRDELGSRTVLGYMIKTGIAVQLFGKGD